MMKARLLLRDADVDWSGAPPWNAEALTADLALDTLIAAMAQSDKRIDAAARRIVLSAVAGDVEVIRFRQGVLKDCLENPALVRKLYALATEASDKAGKRYLGMLARYPHWVLRDALELMRTFANYLVELRNVADNEAHRFTSEGWSTFFAMAKRELGDEFFVRARRHLREIKVDGPLLLGTRLAGGNKAGPYTLHPLLFVPWSRWRRWWEAIRGLFAAPKLPPYSFAVHPRDEAGVRQLEKLRDRGLVEVSNAVGKAKDHVRNFFDMLAQELAFYVGCLNLHDRLVRMGASVSFPGPVTEKWVFSTRGLYDVCLALRTGKHVVGNDADARGKDLIVITGANQGGKSTFLRSIGLAQLMMQAGMFVPADAFGSTVSSGLYSHYKREEDATMESGKFDEELARMSEIVDHIRPGALILFNESFAATNEREGSEIARQIVTALLGKSIRVAYVTHLFELANGFHETRRDRSLFLRAEREASGGRTFRLIESAPLSTSFGGDLYDRLFVEEKPRSRMTPASSS